VARPDVCALANNHVLDFGRGGLAETLATLARAGLRSAGAGRDAAGAQRAAVISLAGRGRVAVTSCGAASSGIPRGWAAGVGRPGVHLLPSLSRPVAGQVASRAQAGRRPGDMVVISLHWGPNWGYEVRRDEVAFAHRLIDDGVDLVHGHSAHHPRPIEVYRGKLILYGCGDFIDDYEGIAGYQEYRDDLRLGLLRLAPARHRRAGRAADGADAGPPAAAVARGRAGPAVAGRDDRPDQPPVRGGCGTGARRCARASAGR
jgi:poly-gamma-glutamate capsule biosynthesis protein CapA/YwtB (metallophosphatase superfamily)